MTKRELLRNSTIAVILSTSLLVGGQVGQAAVNSQSSANSAAIKSQDASELANKIIQIGEKYLKTPYKYGSSSKTTKTFDCSSFTQRVYKEAGIQLPRDSRQQSRAVKTISAKELKKGDLIFFRSSGTSNPRITHVAIYAGDNKLLHTYGKPGVVYSKFRGTSWEKRVVKVGRILPY